MIPLFTPTNAIYALGLHKISKLQFSMFFFCLFAVLLSIGVREKRAQIIYALFNRKIDQFHKS